MYYNENMHVFLRYYLRSPFTWILSSVLGIGVIAAQSAVASPLKVNEAGTHLLSADGDPFVWLGDTAWELFHRLSREEAELYLENRAEKGFSIIQAVPENQEGASIPDHAAHQQPLLPHPLFPDPLFPEQYPA